MRSKQIKQKLTTLTSAVGNAGALWYFGYGAYYLFHVVSLYTTTYGIGVVMQVESIGGWVAPLLLSLAVQTMIGVSGHRLRKAWQQGRSGIVVSSTAILLICVSISIGFANAYWWHFLRSESVARGVALSQNDRITRPVQAFTHHLTLAADDLERLASYSAERAATERAAGGTCEAIGGGRGPRTRLREADERMFRLHADRFRDATGKAEAAMGQLQDLRENYDPAGHDRYEAAVNRIMQQVRPLVNTSHEPTIAQLEARIARGRAELVDDQDGERYRCPDSQLEDFVRQVTGTLRQLQDVGNDVPAELGFHRPDHQASLAVAYGRLATLLRLAPDDDGSPAPEAADVVPLLFAVTVDFVIFMLPVLLSKGDDGDGDHRDFVDEINKIVEPEPRAPDIVTRRLLDFAFKENESRNPYDLLNTFRIEHRRRDEIVLPFAPEKAETAESAAARRFLQLLGRRPHVRQFRPTPRLRRQLRQLRQDPDVEFVTVYRLEPEFMIALAQERVRQYSVPSADDSSRHGPLGVAS